MTNVELSPNDREDILQLLDYALEKKKQEKPEKIGRWHWDNSKYWEFRIPQLKELIKGKKVYSGIYQSSMGALSNNDERGSNDSDI